MKTTANIIIRKSDERGHANHGWLDSRFSFSFAEYHDPRHMGFRTLQVINEDVIEAGQGFGTHPHRDMEIITYVIEGEIAHKDSMGTVSVIAAGNLQRMSAGTGVTHSEFNPSDKNRTHLMQIWIIPATKGLKPSYEERSIENTAGPLTLVAADQNPEGVMKIHQDARLFIGSLKNGEETTCEIQKGRGAWVQMIKGSITLNGTALKQGDGAAIENESAINIKGIKPARFLLFDLN